MQESIVMQKINLSQKTLWLIAIVLAFVLLLVFIWLWYDAKIYQIDKQTKPITSIYYIKPTIIKPCKYSI